MPYITQDIAQLGIAKSSPSYNQLYPAVGTENTYIVLPYIKMSNEVGRIDNFRALARKLSFLPTEKDIFDIRQHYVRILFIFQRLIC